MTVSIKKIQTFGVSSQEEFKSGLFHQRTRHGQDLWLEATYNPIFNDAGVVTQVVKFASDVTDQVLKLMQPKKRRKWLSKRLQKRFVWQSRGAR